MFKEFKNIVLLESIFKLIISLNITKHYSFNREWLSWSKISFIWSKKLNLSLENESMKQYDSKCKIISFGRNLTRSEYLDARVQLVSISSMPIWRFYNVDWGTFVRTCITSENLFDMLWSLETSLDNEYLFSFHSE